MRRSLGRPMRFLASLAVSTSAGAATGRAMDQGAAGKRVKQPRATYAHRGSAVPSIIFELPGERAEALFIAMAALVPTAGEHSEI